MFIPAPGSQILDLDFFSIPPIPDPDPQHCKYGQIHQFTHLLLSLVVFIQLLLSHPLIPSKIQVIFYTEKKKKKGT